MFCRTLPYYIQEQVKNFNVDSLYDAAQGKAMITKSGWIDDDPFHYLYMPYGFIPDPDYEYMGEESIYKEGTQYGTILTTQWAQSYPYNDKLPYISGTYQKAYAGCTLIAMIQIMAYHKKPYQNVTTADWGTVRPILSMLRRKATRLYSDDFRCVAQRSGCRRDGHNSKECCIFFAGQRL